MKVHYMNWMIDTLRYVKALEEVGVDRKVAECQAEVLSQVLEGAAQTILTTKEDLKGTEVSLRTDIQLLKEDLKGTEASLRTDIQLLKEDLKRTEASLRSDIQLLKEDLKGTEASLRSELKLLDTNLRSDMQFLDKNLRSDMQQQELRLTQQMHTIMIKTISILGGLIAFMGGLSTLLHFY